jgi:tRNA A-37 threonylcarbamoyl transferase component Bud32
MSEGSGDSPTGGRPASGSPERLVAGRYRLVREIGRGGMGLVWLGQDELLGRQVAVKELRPLGLTTEADRRVQQARALREARSAARIEHPGAVRLYEVVPATEQDEAVYLIMELVEGRTLEELIARDGALPAPRVAGYGLQLLDVLEAAHALGIVHRDVKPGNIMITADGRVKLADFGIAHTDGEPRLTTGGVMGTEAYLAPELFDPGPVAPAADLWSLGATLYAAAEGTGPFERESSRATLRAILLDDLPVPRCDPGLAAAIAGLLRRDPADRVTVEETRAHLRPVAAQQLPEQESGSGPAASQAPPRLAWDPTAATGLRAARGAATGAPLDVLPKKRHFAGFPRRIGRRTAFIAAVAVLTAICAAAAGVAVTRLDSGRLSARPVAASSKGSPIRPAASGGPGSATTPAPASAAGTSRGASTSIPQPASTSGTPAPGSGSGSGGSPNGSGGGGSGNAAAYVFWKGTDSDLWEAQGPGGGTLSGPYNRGMGPLGSGPTAGVDGEGHVYVYWEGSGADHNLWEAYWNGASWFGPYDRGMGPLGSAPSVAVTSGGTAYVFWKGTDGNLWEAQGPGGGALSGPYDRGMGVLGSGPTAGVDGGGDLYVYWEGSNGNDDLWEAQGLGGGALSGPYDRGMGPLGSAPSAAVTPGGTAYVYWEGSGADHELWEAQGLGGGALSGPYDRGMGPLGSAPSAAVTPGGTAYVYWEGSGADHELWEAQGLGGGALSGPYDRGMGPLGSAPSAVGALRWW